MVASCLLHGGYRTLIIANWLMFSADVFVTPISLFSLVSAVAGAAWEPAWVPALKPSHSR